MFFGVSNALLTLPRVNATRYLLPLREGGSLPGLVEADDLGTYVMKLRGAGQGRKALVAEIIVAALAREAGFAVPDLVLLVLDAKLGPAEPDQEIQDLLRASVGLNLGVDYLPRSIGLEPVLVPVPAETAAEVVWFDAFVQNVDRSWRNPNLLLWHRAMYLIDHGAALYFHHSWDRRAGAATKPYVHVGDHVLLPSAGPIGAADERLRDVFDSEAIAAATRLVPDEWLEDEPGFASPDDVRAAYVEVLTERLERGDTWVPALEDARAHV